MRGTGESEMQLLLLLLLPLLVPPLLLLLPLLVSLLVLVLPPLFLQLPPLLPLVFGQCVLAGKPATQHSLMPAVLASNQHLLVCCPALNPTAAHTAVNVCVALPPCLLPAPLLQPTR